jgi:hypothetical protein
MTRKIFELAVYEIDGEMPSVVELGVGFAEGSEEKVANCILTGVQALLKNKQKPGPALAALIVLISEEMKRRVPGLAEKIRQQNINHIKNENPDTNDSFYR